ncbi:hypothetical protein ZWY2020_052063 [Hordeum vulgare]|nr:hypothetical protein ZWY2020_052063 [Hordeum vulgare]
MGSLGAVAGLTIAVIFAWKFLRSSSPAWPCCPITPKRPSSAGSTAPAPNEPAISEPKPQPIKHRGVERLLDMMIHYNQVDLSHPDAELRLLEVFYHKIYKIFAPSEKIENINDQYWTLRAEEVCDDMPCFTVFTK